MLEKQIAFEFKIEREKVINFRNKLKISKLKDKF